jgi:diguanylate cyclase (GGDEF)-like protein
LLTWLRSHVTRQSVDGNSTGPISSRLLVVVALAGVAAVCAAAAYQIVFGLDDRHASLQRQRLSAAIEEMRALSGQMAAHLADKLGSRQANASASELAQILNPSSAASVRYQEAFVFANAGRVLAVFPDSTAPPVAITRLMEELLGTLPLGEGGKARTDLVLVDGTPAVAAVAGIHWSDAGLGSAAVATVTPIDQAMLGRFERVLGLESLSLDVNSAPGERTSLSLSDQRGRIIGWLSWKPDRPALATLARLATLLAIFTASLFALALLVPHKLRGIAPERGKVTLSTDIDPLTRIASRPKILDVLDRALVARTPDQIVLLVVANLDGFTEINDSLGYRVGDELLIAAARRLRELAPAAATLGRVGSDEFALIMSVDNPPAAAEAANAVMNGLAEPFMIGEQKVQIGACVGLALAPRDGENRDEIMRRAELALRAAKRRGRGTLMGFDLAIEQEFQDRLFITRALRHAIAEDALEVHYQPIVSSSTLRVLGVEALLRWRHRTRGEIQPEVFIPIAEQAGLMPQLGEFVLRRAIADAARWKNLFVSINLSPLQVRDPRLVDLVASILKHTGMAPGRVLLEVTEGVLIDDPENAIARLNRLRALGVKIALDDFGSGYSSLRYLQRFPIDKLKIDKSFVAPLGKSGSAGVIIQAIIALGRALNLVVLAEGVETEEQRMLLRLAGCDEMQGHLFSKPLKASEVDTLIARDARDPDLLLAAMAAAAG